MNMLHALLRVEDLLAVSCGSFPRLLFPFVFFLLLCRERKGGVFAGTSLSMLSLSMDLSLEREVSGEGSPPRARERKIFPTSLPFIS